MAVATWGVFAVLHLLADGGATATPPTPPTWTIVPDWNAVSSGQQPSTKANLQLCQAAAFASGAVQFSWNSRSHHCFISTAQVFGGTANPHVTSGCIAAKVAACRIPPSPPPPAPRSKDFPPGWNGLALTPPMGWRSWNALGATTTQTDVFAMLELLVDGSAFGEVQQQQTLAALGYADVGIDEGWEGCGEGMNGSQHDAEGDPVIYNRSFPDMAALATAAHLRNITIGWYENGCACGELIEKEINYVGDVRSADTLGFDGVKFDGCGAQNNHTRYAELFNRTGCVRVRVSLPVQL